MSFVKYMTVVSVFVSSVRCQDSVNMFNVTLEIHREDEWSSTVVHEGIRISSTGVTRVVEISGQER